MTSPSSFLSQVGAADNSVSRRTRSKCRDAGASAKLLSAPASPALVSFVSLDDSDEAKPEPAELGAASPSFPPQVRAAAISVARRTRSRCRNADASAKSLPDPAPSSPVSFLHLGDSNDAKPDPPRVVAAANSVARRTRSRCREAADSAALPSASSSLSPVSLIRFDDSDPAKLDPVIVENQSISSPDQRGRSRSKSPGTSSVSPHGDLTVPNSSSIAHVSSPLPVRIQTGLGGSVSKRTRSRFLNVLATPRVASPSATPVVIDLNDSDDNDGDPEISQVQCESNDEPTMPVQPSAGGAVDATADSADVGDGQPSATAAVIDLNDSDDNDPEISQVLCESNDEPTMPVEPSAGGAVDATADSADVGDGQKIPCAAASAGGVDERLPCQNASLGSWHHSSYELEAVQSLDISVPSCQLMEAELLSANTSDMWEALGPLADVSLSEGHTEQELGRLSAVAADSSSVEEMILEADTTLGAFSSDIQQIESELRGSNMNTGNMSEGASSAALPVPGRSRNKEELTMVTTAAVPHNANTGNMSEGASSAALPFPGRSGNKEELTMVATAPPNTNTGNMSEVASSAALPFSGRSGNEEELTIAVIAGAAASSSTERIDENFTGDSEMYEDNSGLLPALGSDNTWPNEAAASALVASSSGDNIGKTAPQVISCVAGRTRAKLWGDKLKPVDYTKFFKKTLEPEEEDDPYMLVSSSSFSSSMSESYDSSSFSDEDNMRRRTRISSRWVSGEFYNLDEDSGEEYIPYRVRQSPAFRDRKRNRKSSSFYAMRRKRQRLLQKKILNDGSTYTSDSGSISFSSFSDSEDAAGTSAKLSRRKRKAGADYDDDDRPRRARTRTRNRPMVDRELLKTLVDTISKEDAPHEEGGFMTDEPKIPTFNPEATGERLPLIFSFGDGPKPPQKTDYDKEMDKLWDEYNLSLRSIDICSYDSEKDEEKQYEKNQSSIHCTQEKHSYILDDEFGIVCKFCFAVLLEMRNILPNFAINSSIYSKMLLSDRKDGSKLDQLCSQDSGHGLTDLTHLSTGTVWDLVPGARETMYPHQQEGFEFIWRNLAGDISLDKLKNSPNTDAIGGCVISHAPGTGKTRLSIMFLKSYMAAYPNCRPVILAPRGMLTMWEKEFVKWKVEIPFFILNKDDNATSTLPMASSRSKGVWQMRLMTLCEWIKGNGVLGMSYGLFERLVTRDLKKCPEDAQFSKILIEKPGLFILDEGHTPRNETSKIWKVLKKVKAERRIILSGTPFQNNFGELYNTLCLVRPKFAENITVKEPNFRPGFSGNFPISGATKSRKSIGRDKWTSLTSSIDDESLKKLRLMISPFVHVHNGSILKSLPGLRECLIVLELLPQQKRMTDLIESCNSEPTFAFWYKISLVAIHPALCAAGKLTADEKAGIDEKNVLAKRLNPNEGAKTRFVVELVRLSSSLKEKVLIFSQFLEPLSLMKDQLLSLFNWTEGREILQMDGKICMRQRQTLIDKFNDPTSEVRVLLASTRACCEGISLTGASRVVLLDVVWNPSVENQAISRAFRIGQEKIVHTYHLIGHDTRETVKYERQIQKDRISKRVFSSVDRHNDMEEESMSNPYEDKILEEIINHEKLKGMFRQVRPKDSSLLCI